MNAIKKYFAGRVSYTVATLCILSAVPTGIALGTFVGWCVSKGSL